MLRRARVFAVALAAILLAIEGVAAAEPLSTLLGQIAPAKTPEGSVDVVSWVERDGTKPELVVTLIPKGQVKLVADPGIVVTPVPRDGISWAAAQPVSRVDGSRNYFAEPPTIRLPFAGEDGKPVEASVEYAYCLVDYQCLFGEARVSAPTRSPPS
ncbi:MAG TPA: hypothetical protein VFY87_04315 [Geminicoccaceae bacterium]|jgi:hypothetical protein|nr:hypothetical protein [Geminicoccaceae bacterium]